MCFVEEFLLDDPNSYRYLSNGKMMVDEMDETQMYRELIEAMDIMGISPEEQAAIHKTISAVLLFGNMQFKQERNTDQATLPDNTGENLLVCFPEPSFTKNKIVCILSDGEDEELV